MKSKYIVASLALGSMALAQTAQDAVLLRLRVAEGTADHYAFTARNSNQATLPSGQVRESNTDYTQDMYITYGKTNIRGETDLTLEVKNFRVTSKTPASGPGDMKFTGKTNNRFELSDLKSVANDPNHLALVSTMTQSWRLFALPEKAVKVGDTWNRKFAALTAVGLIEKDLVLEYAADEPFEGKDLVVVTTGGDIPINADLSASRGAPAGEITATGLMKLSMVIKFEKQTGRLFSSESTVTSTMSIAASGGTSAMTGSAQNSMRLVVPEK